MTGIKKHIAFKLLSFSLAVCLLAPTVIKFTHIFSHHEHTITICNINDTHLHDELNLECNFYKFKLNTPFSFTFNTIEFIKPQEEPFLIQSQYTFLSKFTYLKKPQRGPPYYI